MSTETRKIYYYKINRPNNAKDFDEKLRQICQLEEGHREVVCNNVSVNVKIHEDEPDLIAASIRLLRNSAPTIGRVGTNDSRQIEMEDAEGVNEQTHFVYQKSTRILAIEHNSHGPKIALIVKAINMIYKGQIDPQAKKNYYEMIVDHTALDRVQAAYGIKMVTTQLSTGEDVTAIQNSVSLPAAYRSAIGLGDTQEVEIILKPKAYSKALIMRFGQFMSDILWGNPTNISKYKKLKVKVQTNETGGVEEINLLDDFMVNEVNVIKLNERSRAIDSQDMILKLKANLVNRGFNAN
jgi:hypothetical protein